MAGTRALTSASDELHALMQSAHQRQLIDYYSQNAQSRDLATRVGQIASSYPWMAPGVPLALAQGGYDAEHPVTQAAAEGSAKVKRKRGWGWHSFGDVVSGAADAGWSGLKAGARAAAEDASFGYEAIQGAVREAYTGVTRIASGDFGTREQYTSLSGYTEPLTRTVGQTQLGISTGAALRGKSIDAGSGFLPGGELRAEQVRRARAQGLIDGHAITPGRIVAHAFLEPGSKPYNLVSGLTDAALSLGADPTAKALNLSSATRAADRTFTAGRKVKILDEAGGVLGIRQTTIPENVDAWLQSAEGRKVRDFLTHESDFQRVWDRTGRKLPADLAAQLSDARTDGEVTELLRGSLGLTVREKPAVGGFGVAVRDLTSRSRLWAQMPGRVIPLDDSQEAVEQLDRWQRNAKLPAEVVAKNNGAMARAVTREQKFDVAASVMRQTQGALQSSGVSAQAARRLTTLWRDSHEDLRRYAVDEIGQNVPLPWAQIDGAGQALPTPHLFTEFLNHGIPLPDAREMRRATSKLGRLINAEVAGTRPLDSSVALADWVTQKVFKPAVLLRGAWTVRVVGEEQLRMAASGLTSLISHPLSHIAAMVGDKGGGDVLGSALSSSEEFSKAMTRGSGGFLDRTGVIRAPAKVLYDKNHEHYAAAWADELSKLTSDPVAKAVATDFQAARRWFWAGEGSKYRQELATGERLADLGTDQRAADTYLSTVLDRIKTKTSGDPRLVAAVATGHLGDLPLRTLGQDREVTGKFVRALQGIADEGVGPERVVGDLMVHGKQKVSRYDRAVESMFSALMSRPTNALSRSPAFKQFYWQRVGELAADLHPADASRLAMNAQSAKVADRVVADLKAKALSGSGRVRLDDVDALAKGHALDSTRKLLYDLSDRAQFDDITRNIFPFVQAWKEIAATWARIGYRHPESLRRFQQGVEGARGSGFFYSDPETGEEVFAYPGTEWVTRQALDIPVPLTAKVSGLNLFSTSLLPGFGPVVQYPASRLIPETPEWDWIRSTVLPFGDPDTAGGLAESVLPAWAQRLRVAFDAHPTGDQQRIFANTVMDVQRALLTTGKYDISTRGGQAVLHTDSVRRAKLLYFLRGVTQWGAPSAPQPEFLAQDKDGRWVTAQGLLTRYDELLKEQGPDKASSAFLEQYGTDAVLYLQGKTRAAVPGVEPTKAALDWTRTHPGIVQDYPTVFGWFAPHGGEFEYTAYRAQLRSGQRESIDPADAIRLANSRLGGMLYQQARKKVGESPSEQERTWLSAVRDEIRSRFPGFDDTHASGPDLATTIEALSQAATDKRLSGTAVGKVLGLYLTARRQALGVAKQRGFTTLGGKKVADLRTWLGQIGEAAAQAEPQFGPLWERVLSREVTP